MLKCNRKKIAKQKKKKYYKSKYMLKCTVKKTNEKRR